jgi:hypothetical protein
VDKGATTPGFIAKKEKMTVSKRRGTNKKPDKTTKTRARISKSWTKTARIAGK